MNITHNELGKLDSSTVYFLWTADKRWAELYFKTDSEDVRVKEFTTMHVGIFESKDEAEAWGDKLQKEDEGVGYYVTQVLYYPSQK